MSAVVATMSLSLDGIGPYRLEQISGRTTSLVTHVRYRALTEGAADSA